MEVESIIRLFSGEMGGVYAFTEESWLQLLELAREYGWEPQGTRSPPEPENTRWAADYLPPRPRIVSAGDAAGLAAALEQAEHNLPDLRHMEREHERRRLTDAETGDYVNETSDEENDWLDEFRSFCLAGEFRIG